MGVAGHVRGNPTETNEWVCKYHELVNLTLADFFKFHSKFLSTLQTRNHEVNRQMFVVLHFPLSGKRNYVVEEFSAKQQRGIISWDHYLTT